MRCLDSNSYGHSITSCIQVGGVASTLVTTLTLDRACVLVVGVTYRLCSWGIKIGTGFDAKSLRYHHSEAIP